jgi:hypothetical protein
MAMARALRVVVMSVDLDLDLDWREGGLRRCGVGLIWVDVQAWLFETCPSRRGHLHDCERECVYVSL